MIPEDARLLTTVSWPTAHRDQIRDMWRPRSVVVEPDRDEVLEELLDEDLRVVVVYARRVPRRWNAKWNVRWIQLHAAGATLLPGEAPADVIVTTTHVNGAAVAEHAIALLLAIRRRLPDLVRLSNERLWPNKQTRVDMFGVPPLAGSTLLVLGYGAIGKRVCMIGRSLGMNVSAISRTGASTTGDVDVRSANELADLAIRSDAVVCTLPGTKATHHLINAEFLGRLRPGAAFVNVGRGSVVDERALVDALCEGRLACAAIDVADREPLQEDSELWRAPNLLVSPHVAGFYPSFRDDAATAFTSSLQRFLSDQPLDHVVDPDLGY